MRTGLSLLRVNTITALRFSQTKAYCVIHHRIFGANYYHRYLKRQYLDPTVHQKFFR